MRRQRLIHTQVPANLLGGASVALLISVITLSCTTGTYGMNTEAAESGEWPDRDWLVHSLVQPIETILSGQDRETGQFGSKPWICRDQNVIFPLAVAWDTQHPDNPFFHDSRLLTAICAGGKALADAQDRNGKWTFRKKDNSTWGQIHMPWTYSRWMRAYAIIHDVMPPESRKIWEKGLLRGYSAIAHSLEESHVHNIPAHHAMGLAIAGKEFDRPDWRRIAAEFMKRVVQEQSPEGFWSEHSGPVVGYNQVYVDALGIYFSVTGDRNVLQALERAARFHAALLWTDGTSVSAVDERQIYHRKRCIGNPGFSHTAIGRGYLLQQTAPLREEGKFAPADYAAAMLSYGGTGTGTPVVSATDTGSIILGDNRALVLRRKPWQFCLSAYYSPVSDSRWIQDRQNFLDIFHDDLGLIVGGGNTKLQPYWSTFTVGNPELLSHQEGNTTPNFTPDIDLSWVPNQTVLSPDDASPRLQLSYGNENCDVAVTPGDEGLTLHFSTALNTGRPVQAHLPILKRRGGLRLASGKKIYLGEAPVTIPAVQTGGAIIWQEMKVTVPTGARLIWPARQHNPYKKDGSSSLQDAKLVLVMPFAKDNTSYDVTVSCVKQPPLDGLAFDARDLPVYSSTNTRMKPLNGLQSFFLGADQKGDEMTFTLNIPENGRYEITGDFVTFPGYGIVQLLLNDNGTPQGRPFDAYSPELDVSGPVPFGAATLSSGKHKFTIRLCGKNPKSKKYFISVRKFILKRVD